MQANGNDLGPQQRDPVSNGGRRGKACGWRRARGRVEEVGERVQRAERQGGGKGDTSVSQGRISGLFLICRFCGATRTFFAASSSASCQAIALPNTSPTGLCRDLVLHSLIHHRPPPSLYLSLCSLWRLGHVHRPHPPPMRDDDVAIGSTGPRCVAGQDTG